LKIFANVLLGDIIVTLPGIVDSFQKALDVHRYYDIPIIAVIENMSYFECEHGSKYRLFGEPIASKLINDVPVFELPFQQKLLENILFDHEAFDKIVEIIKGTEVKKRRSWSGLRKLLRRSLRTRLLKS